MGFALGTGKVPVLSLLPCVFVSSLSSLSLSLVLPRSLRSIGRVCFGSCSGGFSTVRIATSKTDKKECAVKIIQKKALGSDLELVGKEIEYVPPAPTKQDKQSYEGANKRARNGDLPT